MYHRHAKGGLYVRHMERTALKALRAGEHVAFRLPDGERAEATVTDDVERGDNYVLYSTAMLDQHFARPAWMWLTPGRFVPTEHERIRRSVSSGEVTSALVQAFAGTSAATRGALFGLLGQLNDEDVWVVGRSALAAAREKELRSHRPDQTSSDAWLAALREAQTAFFDSKHGSVTALLTPEHLIISAAGAGHALMVQKREASLTDLHAALLLHRVGQMRLHPSKANPSQLNQTLQEAAALLSRSEETP